MRGSAAKFVLHWLNDYHIVIKMTYINKIVGRKLTMQSYTDLNIGAWYKRPDLKKIFEIVAIDQDEDCIEIQYFDGEIEELDLDTWNELQIISVAAPEDWSGPYEMNKEDLENYDDDLHPNPNPTPDWNSPFKFIDREDNF